MRSASQCTQCSRLILVGFNTIFFILGLVFIGVGIAVLVSDAFLVYVHYTNLVELRAPLKSAAQLMVIVGVVMLVMSFVGCIGGMRENSCMLLSYSLVLSLLLVLQIAAGATVVAFGSYIADTTLDTMFEITENNYGLNNTQDRKEMTIFWDYFQMKMECCGPWPQGEDLQWDATSWWNSSVRNNWNVPKSCCVVTKIDVSNIVPKDSTICNKTAIDTKPDTHYFHTRSCLDAFVHESQHWAEPVAGVAFGLFLVQIIGVVLSCQLRCAINREYGKF